MASNQSNSTAIKFYEECLEEHLKCCEKSRCVELKKCKQQERNILEEKVKKNEKGIDICVKTIEEKDKEIKDLELRLKNQLTGANSTNSNSKLTIEPDAYNNFSGSLTENQISLLRSISFHKNKDCTFVSHLIKAIYNDDSTIMKEKSITGRSNKPGIQKNPITPEKLQLIQSVYRARMKNIDSKERIERSKKLNQYVNIAIQNNSKDRTANMCSSLEKIGVIISNCENELLVFKNIDTQMSVNDLKVFIEGAIGGSVSTMMLTLVDGNKPIATLDSDEEALSSYELRPNIGVHVDDDPTTFFEQKSKTLTINGRCIVSIKDTEHVGTIRYKGKLHSKDGIFVGVEFDEPTGNIDGTMDGVIYFACEKNHGFMTHIVNVSCLD